MRRFTSRRAPGTLAELNITPLLDLAFVLLIIFMITTPLIENRIDLVVPTSATAQTPMDPSTVLTVEITRAGEIRSEGAAFQTDTLEAHLAMRKAADATLAVVVRPDKDLPIQRFIDVMDVLKRVGIGKVGVMTHPEQP